MRKMKLVSDMEYKLKGHGTKSYDTKNCNQSSNVASIAVFSFTAFPVIRLPGNIPWKI